MRQPRRGAPRLAHFAPEVSRERQVALSGEASGERHLALSGGLPPPGISHRGKLRRRRGGRGMQVCAPAFLPSFFFLSERLSSERNSLF